MEKEYKFISAVIYIHNEQKYIQNFIEMLYEYLKEHFYKFEIICVDDASRDNSIRKIQSLVKEKELINVSLISMDIYQGREAGMEAGVDLSIGDYVYELEWIDISDLEQYRSRLWEAFTLATKGYDIVSCLSDGPKSFASAIFYKIYNDSNFNYTPLVPERFRIVTRRAINRVSRMNKSIVYRKALYANCGLKGIVLRKEGRADFKPKEKDVQKNKSKLGMNVLLVYTGAIPRVIKAFSILLAVNMVCSIVYSIFDFLILNSTRGFVWTGVSFVGLILGGMGYLVSKYLEIILELVLKNEKYVVGSVDKLVNSEK